MKSKSFISLAAAAMLLSLAACSKDASEPVVTPDGPDAYAKVTITMGKAGSRASEADDEFDAGTEAEGHVSSIMLVVYDAAGNVVGFGSTNNTTDAAGSGSDNVSDTYSNKIVKLTITGDKSNAATVVAYVNADNDIVDFATAREQKTDVYQNADGNFIMTNSGYFNADDTTADKWVAATEIKAGSIYSTQDAAAAGSEVTKIYVERLAAKVSVDLKTSTIDTTADVNIESKDGLKKYSLKFNAEDAVWAPTGTAPEMYKLKKEFEKTLLSTSDWTANAVDYNRSYWAKGVYYTTPYSDLTSTLNYLASNALRRTDGAGKAMGETDYTTEHTYGSTVVGHTDYNALGAATSAIVLGQYQLVGDGADEKFQDEDGNYDFFLLLTSAGAKANYTIFNKKELMVYLVEDANKLELYTAASGDEKVSEDNVETYFNLVFKKQAEADKAKKYFLELKKDVTLYKKGEDGNTQYEAEELAAALVNGSNARHYNEGWAYFFAPIEHLATSGVGQYGVVRNHSYVLTISEIKSLGAPLDDDHFNPDPDDTDPDDPDPDDPGEKPIVPDPTTEAVIKAELKVLSWHVVDQDVKL